MAINVVVDEAELSIYANTIQQQAEFLNRAITEYADIIQTLLLNRGIKDDRISPALAELRASLSVNQHVVSAYGDKVKSITNSALSAFADADKFVFPQDSTTIIANLLSRFL